MLGASGHEDTAIADHARDQPGDRAADMALGIDVGVVEHGMTVAANMAATVGFAFHQHRGDAGGVPRGDLRCCRYAEIGQ